MRSKIIIGVATIVFSTLILSGCNSAWTTFTDYRTKTELRHKANEMFKDSLRVYMKKHY